MQPSPENTQVVKLSMKMFRYDEVLTDWGWTHDVYFDTNSKLVLVSDFPEKDHFFEIGQIPELGPATLEINGESYNVKFF